ncbi:hypothetical protein [Methylosinus sp. PW1]|uniref:hypothetical protein n=1 Tax=Methylosinus sp. PW1 TaxID=107636 RepID=UPI0012EC5E46|nr:hypothetical protein [Methylosinus sp. PW1]
MKLVATSAEGTNHLFEDRCVVAACAPGARTRSVLRRQGSGEGIAQFGEQKMLFGVQV